MSEEKIILQDCIACNTKCKPVCFAYCDDCHVKMEEELLEAERRGEERGARAGFKAARCENVPNLKGEIEVMEILHHKGIEFTNPLFHVWFEDWHASEEYKEGK